MSRRLENLDPDRQRRLFDVAAQEFAANGFDGASLNRILAQSGMGKSSLYYYFDDKADLFATMIERSLAALFDEIGGLDPETLTAETYWPTFETRYREGLAAVESNPALVRLGGIFYQLRAVPGTGAATGRLFEAARCWVEAAIARGQALGVVRRDLPQSLLVEATMGLLETLDRWILDHWSSLSEEEKTRLPEQHIGLFRDLLERRAGERDPGSALGL
ncbi:TetR/AcrR family transcriptional regulator [Salipiger abyssi]|uniref:Transcriptional regulator n=1 Tax=Salipiger abyssi TaxID=1250539 RepID=A0A1P8URR4_9RHOB|nr:TetR/AcrR family transcriptional regulator [Salipiger abyssi]APZ52089.1 transcriptional regulator [Salipiger abyssi]